MQFSIETKGHNDIIDITQKVEKMVGDSEVKDGLVLVFVPGSTATVTTIEYEPGVLEDLKRVLEKIAPESEEYEHNKAWGDGNGYAHVRAALMKPSLCLPIENGKIIHGTWQQIVLIDFDNRPRTRNIVVKVIKNL